MSNETRSVTTPLLEALNALPGVRARRQHAGRLRTATGWVHLGSKGWPDILVVAGERCMFIETKRPGGKLSPEQHEFIMQATRDGIRVRCAETVRDGIEHVQEFLREVGR